MKVPKLVISINSAWNFVNFRAGLIRALIERGYDIVAVAPDDGYADAIRALGCRYVPINVDSRGVSPIRDARVLGAYFTLLGRERPDAFLGYTIKPNIYGSIAAHRYGIPVINNIAGLGTAFLARGWLNLLASTLYRRALRRSSTIFFQNSEDRERFVREGLADAARARVLPGSGIDLNRFTPSRPSTRPGAALRFLMIARLLGAKGVREYVAAAAALRSEGLAAEFLLLGSLAEGRDAIPAEEAAAWHGSGAIRYLGAVDDVRPLIADADCVVLPSYAEGTPRTLLEGAAMARPLIATAIPGSSSVVDEGVNGLLVPPRDVAALTEAMRHMATLSTRERAAMGSASRRKVEREFDEAIVIDAYLGALRNAGVPPPG